MALVVVTGAAALAQEFVRKDADSLERKLAAILERGAAASQRKARPVRTPLTDREVNAYFRYQGQEYLPVGVVDPRITIAGADRVEARAMVDLDAVRNAKARAWSDPLAWVTGALELRAAGRIVAADGMGRLQLESATLAGVPIPKSLLQEVVSYYSRTPDTPDGFRLDQPFALPHHIREVVLQRGTAVIVQ